MFWENSISVEPIYTPIDLSDVSIKPYWPTYDVFVRF